jgi:hypothetical protein
MREQYAGEEQRNVYGFVVGDNVAAAGHNASAFVEIRGRTEMSSAAACRGKMKWLDERRRRRCSRQRRRAC